MGQLPKFNTEKERWQNTSISFDKNIPLKPMSLSWEDCSQSSLCRSIMNLILLWRQKHSMKSSQKYRSIFIRAYFFSKIVHLLLTDRIAKYNTLKEILSWGFLLILISQLAITKSKRLFFELNRAAKSCCFWAVLAARPVLIKEMGPIMSNFWGEFFYVFMSKKSI